jgi:hypothetical protein
MIFRLSDRTLISRVRIFVIWQELAEFQAEVWLLVAAWIWAISWHGGPVQTAGTVRERAAHKSRAAWVCSSLGDYMMRDSSHLQESERELISQTRRKSAAAACFSVKAGISQSACFSVNAGISQSAWFSVKARISQSAWFSVKARISQSSWFFLAANICTYFQYFSALSMRQHLIGAIISGLYV